MKVLDVRRLIVLLLFWGGIGLILLGTNTLLLDYAYAQDDATEEPPQDDDGGFDFGGEDQFEAENEFAQDDATEEPPQDDDGGFDFGGEDQFEAENEFTRPNDEEPEEEEEPGAAGEPEYAGFRECRSCHGTLARAFATTGHALALIDAEAEDNQALILADFDTGDELRTVLFPDENEPRPFTRDDIAYAIGSGKFIQRYVYETADGSYMVLPAEWNTVEQVWQPFEIVATWPDPMYDFGVNCAYCHTSGFDVRDYRWEEPGVMCESCHGLGSTHIEVADDVGEIEDEETRDAIEASINLGLDSQVCGQCHSRGLAADGIHTFPTDYAPGGNLLETYNPISENDTAHWWVTGHASQTNMQFNEWLNTNHATAYETAITADYFEESCLSCHNAGYRRMERIIEETGKEDWLDPVHAAEVAPFGVTCATCHNPHADSELGFAAYLPTDSYTLCADCHSNPPHDADDSAERVIHHPVKEMFEGIQLIPEIQPVAGSHFTVENGPNCQTCHMPTVSTLNGPRISHNLTPIMPEDVFNVEGLQDACTGCHTDIVTAQDVQTIIDKAQTSIETRLTAARQQIGGSSPAWMTAALDFVENDGSMGVHNYLYADALLDAVEKEQGTTSTVISTLPQTATTAELLLSLEEKTNSDVIIAGMNPLLLGIAGLGGVLVLAGVGVTFSRRRLFGILSILVGVVMVGGAVIARETPEPLNLSGNNDSCLFCHATFQYDYRFPNGSTLDLQVRLDGLHGSVHGLSDKAGETFGCLDCHGASPFPHANLPFDTLSSYRVEMSRICIDCHTDDAQHYADVLERNIRVGCSDCHTAHYVSPADQLLPAPTPTLIPRPPSGG